MQRTVMVGLTLLLVLVTVLEAGARPKIESEEELVRRIEDSMCEFYERGDFAATLEILKEKSIEHLGREALYMTKLSRIENRFRRCEYLPQQAQESLKLHPLVCRIEDGLPNAVKAIAKQALGEPLMGLERNRFGLVLPSAHVPSPAKRDRQHTA